MGMKRMIHVNQHAIRRNIHRNGVDPEPVITVKTYKSNHYGFSVEFKNGRIVYSPCKPLACGAKVWIETEEPVIVDGVEV